MRLFNWFCTHAFVRPGESDESAIARAKKEYGPGIEFFVKDVN